MKKFSVITTKNGSEYNFVEEDYSSELELKNQRGQHFKTKTTYRLATSCSLPFLHQLLSDSF